MDVPMDIPSVEFLVRYLQDHGVQAHLHPDGRLLHVQDADELWRTIPATLRAVRGYLGE
jgi:hypothetical protein